MFKIKKTKLLIELKGNRGISYVELIVVLSIISILSAISLYNYQSFRIGVEIKNLTSDIGLKIIQTQKNSISGEINPALDFVESDWQPSYGVHFNLDTSYTENGITLDGNKVFYYFADADTGNDFDFDYRGCEINSEPFEECLDVYKINKANYQIKGITAIITGGDEVSLNDLTILFRRPSQSAIFETSLGINPENPIDYVKITLTETTENKESSIYVYSSGRIQID